MATGITGRLSRLAGALVLQYGWQRRFSALGLGLVSALATAPLDLVPLLFITFPALMWLMDGVYADARSTLAGQFLAAFAPGWWFGFGYFAGSLWWIGNALLVEADVFAWALPLAVIALPAVLAIFWGVGTVIARLLWSDGWGRAFALAFGLGIAEYLRATLFTGFPWNAIGYAAMPVPVLMQSASVIGLHAMNVVAVLAFTLPLAGLTTGGGDGVAGMSGRLTRTPVFLALILIGLHAGFGVVRMVTSESRPAESVTLRLMQPSIAQGEKLAFGNGDQVVSTYLDVSLWKPGETRATQGSLEGIDYLIWPESAFPFLLTEQPEVLAAIADLLPEGTRLITGAMRAEPGAAGNPYGKVYNSLLVIDGAGEIVAAADKTHLVPFGEYLPFQEVLESIGLEQVTRVHGGFDAGTQRRALNSEVGASFIPLICYEIIFSGQIRDEMQAGRDDPAWIVNLTNDAWYGRTPGPYQHLRQARVRAVEEGLPVARVANNGVSAVIDAFGRVEGQLGLDQVGTADVTLPGTATPTVFSRIGLLVFFASLVACLAISLGARQK